MHRIGSVLDFFFQAEDGIRDDLVTGVQTCALPILAFVQEALVLSIIDIVQTSLEAKRHEFIKKQELEGQMLFILKPLIKRSEVQFKTFIRITKSKIERQTLVTYLTKAVDKEILNKRKTGRSTYYSLNFEAPETETLQKWLKFANQRLLFIPDDIKLI